MSQRQQMRRNPDEDYDYEAERARRRKLREERIRREKIRKRKMITRIAAAVALLAVLVLVILVVVKRNSGSVKKNTAVNVVTAGIEASADSGTAVQEDSTQSTTAASTVSGTAASSLSSDLTSIDYSHIPETASTKDEALIYAKALATQYDYDGAVSMLQSVSGYESDADLTEAIADYTAQKAACYAVDVTTVPHVFFHSLLNDDRGLREDIVGSDRAWRNDAAMTTADEFDHMIEDMYEDGYVLISLYDMCIMTENEDGSVSISPNTNLLLPEGKKAFVLSEDDLSYYHTYGIGTQGYATKMVLDENGKVKCEYTNEDGETLIGDYDVVPRLDTFIHNHPDFAYHNARGTVALTGYNGVFGYRTNDYYKDINDEHLDADQVEWLQDHPDFDWEQDVADATAIANAMKEEGWNFASHTYGHINASTKTVEQLQRDNERWMTCNHNIVGDIDIIIFAFGGDIGYVGGYTADNEKYQYFKSQGYSIFCNVDGNIGWTEFGSEYMRTGRVALDGFTMYQAMTEDAASHGTYAKDYEVLGISGIEDFFNPYRITPIDSE